MHRNGTFQEHWLHIDPVRMERYETMFQWNPETEQFYAGARIGEGQIVIDFGCGPGHAAIEFATRVGPSGHIHAMDINEEFIQRTRNRAEGHGFGDRISIHHLTDRRLPMPDACVDRVVARNTMIYVEDPVFTLGEFRRVLRPGGIAHAIESDWLLTTVEPVEAEDWRALIDAASWAWPHPSIGRRLYGHAKQADFKDVSVQVLTSPDTNGRLNGMIQTAAGYAKESGSMDCDRIANILQTVDRAIAERTYLAISPQFIVTAVA